MAKRWGVSACGLSAASLATLFAGVGLSATLMASGMAGSGIATPDIGIYSFPSQVGIGTAGLAQNALRIGGNVTAVAGAASAIRVLTTQVAAANGDVLRGVHIGFNSTPGAFTGIQAKGMEVQGFSTAGFTSPADPVVLDIGAVNGSGITANATNAFGLRIAPPAGATNNYLISHTAPGTFNVSAAGGGTFGALSQFTAAGEAFTLKSLIAGNQSSYFTFKTSVDAIRAAIGFEAATTELWFDNVSGGVMSFNSASSYAFRTSPIVAVALTLSGFGSGTGIVSAGVADSGGSGFRLLRVPN